MHPYIHARVPTYIHSCTHACAHTCIHTYVHARIRTCKKQSQNENIISSLLLPNPPAFCCLLGLFRGAWGSPEGPRLLWRLPRVRVVFSEREGVRAFRLLLLLDFSSAFVDIWILGSLSSVSTSLLLHAWPPCPAPRARRRGQAANVRSNPTATTRRPREEATEKRQI